MEVVANLCSRYSAVFSQVWTKYATLSRTIRAHRNRASVAGSWLEYEMQSRIVRRFKLCSNAIFYDSISSKKSLYFVLITFIYLADTTLIKALDNLIKIN